MAPTRLGSRRPTCQVLPSSAILSTTSTRPASCAHEACAGCSVSCEFGCHLREGRQFRGVRRRLILGGAPPLPNHSSIRRRGDSGVETRGDSSRAPARCPLVASTSRRKFLHRAGPRAQAFRTESPTRGNAGSANGGRWQGQQSVRDALGLDRVGEEARESTHTPSACLGGACMGSIGGPDTHGRSEGLWAVRQETEGKGEGRRGSKGQRGLREGLKLPSIASNML